MLKTKISKNFFYFIVSTIILSLVVGLRGSTRDTLVYVEIFNNIESYDLLNPISFYHESGVEYTYGILAFLFNIFTESYRFFFIFYSFITFYFLYKINELFKYNYIVFLLIYLTSQYFALFQFMQIRQGLALAIAFYASLIFLNKKNNFRFIILGLVAIFTHQTAFVVLAINIIFKFFVNNFDVNKTLFRLNSVFIVLLSFLLSKYVLQDFLISKSSRVETYSEWDEYSSSLDFFRPANIKSIFLLILFILFVNIKDKFLILLVYLYCVSVGFRFGFSDFSILSGRLAVSFAMGELWLMISIITRFKRWWFILLICYIIIQAVITYGYQANYIFYDYFKSLK